MELRRRVLGTAVRQELTAQPLAIPPPGAAQSERVGGISLGIVSFEILQAAQEADLTRVRIARALRWASSVAVS